MINSIITAKPFVGQDPLGFIPLVPNNNGASEYIGSRRITRKYEYSTVTFDADIRVTRDNIIAQVKLDLDTNYSPTVFTDPAKTYDIQYTITTINLDFEALSGSIFHERTWYFYVDVLLDVNVS